ncbi:hypothetical protein Efla_006441 [Eimeria flavescens]
MVKQREGPQQLPLQHLTLPLLLPLLLVLLQTAVGPVCSFRRPPQPTPSLSPSQRRSVGWRPHLTGSNRGSSCYAPGSSSNCSTSSKCSSSSSCCSSDSEPTDCPRCVLLNPEEGPPPVVAGWAAALEAQLAASVGAPSGPPPLPNEGGDSPSAAREAILEVLALEVGIAAETRRALGLATGSQKKHIFLPLPLLGPLSVLKEREGPGTSEDLKGAPAGSPAGWQGSALRAEVSTPRQQPLLSALREAACRAIRWEEATRLGTPPQLVARVAAAKRKGPLASQLARELAAQVATQEDLSGGRAAVHSATLPLTSDEDTLRVLRAYFGPLLAQYDRAANSHACSCCSGAAGNSSSSSSTSSRCMQPGWASRLRILRLKRGPRLSLQLQLPAASPCLAFEGGPSPSLPPPPPLLLFGKGETARAAASGERQPSYQLVSMYKLFRVGAPEALAELLRALWGPRGVLGRAYVASEGLNAQLAVPAAELPSILEELREVPGLEEGGLQVTLDCAVPFAAYWANNPPFDTLHVRSRQQVLRDGFGAPLDWADCGEEVSPAEWHSKLKALLLQRQQGQKRTAVLLDVRNASEFAVGHFKGAECIDTPTFANSFTPGGPLEAALRRAGVSMPVRRAALSEPSGGPPSSRPSGDSEETTGEDVEVLMYCTGGIRCVKAGAFVKQVLGFPRVTRLKGGILAYKNFIRGLNSSSSSALEGSLAGDPFPLAEATEGGLPASQQGPSPSTGPQARWGPSASDCAAGESLFVGSNYVFDHRMCQEVTPDLLARCGLCGGPTGRLLNCSSRQCGRRLALCLSCCLLRGSYCSASCAARGVLERDSQRQAKIQRRLQVRHTHKRMVQQRGLWALRAQQLLAALRQSAAAGFAASDPSSSAAPSTAEALSVGSEPLACRASAERGPGHGLFGGPPWGPPEEAVSQQDKWAWAHRVAAEASSPSLVQAALLQRAEQEARLLTGIRGGKAHFWAGPLQSRILAAISTLQRPRTILDIGAFIGISSLSLAEGLAEGARAWGQAHGGGPRVFAVERDARAAAAARRLVAASPLRQLIQVVEADAMDVLLFLCSTSLSSPRPESCSSLPGGKAAGPLHLLQAVAETTSGGFDLIYLDAEKRKYADYLQLILHADRPLLSPRGLLLIDNTLWLKGQAAAEPLESRASTSRRYARVEEAMQRLRGALLEDPRLSHVSLADAFKSLAQLTSYASKRQAGRRRGLTSLLD